MLAVAIVMITCIVQIMAESPPKVMIRSNMPTDPACSTSIQCCSEVNEAPAASELVLVTNKKVGSDDKYIELVIGADGFIPLYFMAHKNSQLV